MDDLLDIRFSRRLVIEALKPSKGRAFASRNYFRVLLQACDRSRMTLPTAAEKMIRMPDVKDWANECRRKWKENEEYNWGMFFKAAPAVPIGLFGFDVDAQTEGSFGCWLDEGHRGNGFSAEAVKKAVPILRKCDFRTFDIEALPANEGSIRVAEKLGFRNNGVVWRHSEYVRSYRLNFSA